MDKILLTNSDIEFVLKWRDEHKDLVRMGISPLRAVKIVCTESGYTITAIRNGNELKCGINERGKSLGSLTFRFVENGLCQLVKDKTKLSQEDKQSVLTVYSSLMALLVFGTSTIPQEYTETSVKKNKTQYKSKKPSKKNKSNGITYIIRNNGNELKLISKGKHSSPSGTFSVRGHYRRYKSGKVIWISEYTKGDGKKKKGTNYKVRAKKGGKYEW